MPEATRPLLMRWCPRVAPFDAASLAEALWLAVRSRNGGVWYVSRIMGHQWPSILRRNHVRRFTS